MRRRAAAARCDRGAEALALDDEGHGLVLTSSFDLSHGAFVHAVLASSDGGARWTRHELPAGFHPLRVDAVP